MAERAAIESLDALLRLRAALCVLAEDAGIALAEADAEILRTASWLREEQQLYWKREVEKQSELVARARSALKRKEAMKTPLGGRYSTVEEEKNLARVQRRLDEARARRANVRRWLRVLDEEAFAYKSMAQGLGYLIEGEVPKALARLDHMICALQAYASGEGSPVARGSEIGEVADTSAGGQAESVRRAPPEYDTLELCRALRRHAVPAEKRDAVRTGATVAAELAGRPALDAACRAALRGLAAEGGHAGCTPASDERVLIARGVGSAPRVWMVRTQSVPAGDSGWQIGLVDDADAVPEACSVADVLAARPDWEILLGFPPGWLILIDGGEVAGLLRPDDTPVRMSGSSGSGPAEAPGAFADGERS